MKHLLRFFLFIICLFTCIFLYSKYIGIQGTIVKEYRIKNENIPKHFNGIKIVHFSDIHYGITIKEKELKNIVNKINETKPDIVVFTGDLFEKKYKITEKEIEKISSIFSKIETTLGKYAIKGENDNEKEYFEMIMTNSNFININDTFDYIYYKEYTPILLGGISSNLANKKNIKEKTAIIENEITTYRQNNNKNIYSILLMHEPDFIEELDLTQYNLILAGHSHNGQINIPYIQKLFLEKGAKNYYKNYYKIKKTDLYISSGLGTNEYAYRLQNKPSINIYRLESK